MGLLINYEDNCITIDCVQEGRDISAPVLGAEARLQQGEEERLSVSHGAGPARDRAQYRQVHTRRIAGGTLGQWSLNFLEKELNL